LKTQRAVPGSRPAGAERDLEMAVAILRRTGRRLAAALPDKYTANGCIMEP
jgi:translation elongation factor EF-Ts